MFELNPTFDLSNLNGKNGFAIYGVVAIEHTGSSVSTAGDVNGDGIPDIITAGNGGSLYHDESLSYVVFGKKTAWNTSLELSALDGQNGFTIKKVANEVYGCCISVSTAGDVNGDGIADIIMGAPYSSYGGHEYSGNSYVVFGKKTAWNASLDLAALNGKNGFTIHGIGTYDYSGYSVSIAGDINGDGISDILISAPHAGKYAAGASYVVFGKNAAWDASLQLSALNGKNGFVIKGVDRSHECCQSVSTAGDVNQDGIADIIIGSPGAFSGDGWNSPGASYVVFGKKSVWNPSLELSSLNGQNGFTIRGIATGDFCGYSVSAAGDVNGDGIADIIIGAPYAEYNYYGEKNGAGASYVVFGKQMPWNASLELSALNGQNGFVINGIAKDDDTGWFVRAAGDINSDGIADVLIGAPYAGKDNAGSSYVVFGKKMPWDASLELSTLNGQNGFIIEGINSGDMCGDSVSPAGDLNGDGIADVLIGAPLFSSEGSKRYFNGATYVVFGQSSSIGFFSRHTAASEPVTVPTNSVPETNGLMF